MGLDISHDCWHGSYSSFGRFREAIAATIGITLHEMQGFGGQTEWSPEDQEPLVTLLNHSDCDGEIPVERLLPLAKRLRAIADRLLPPAARPSETRTTFPNMERAWKDEALQFAKGCEAAAREGEAVEFH